MARRPPISLCVDGKVSEFASGTTRVFRLNDEPTDGVVVEKGPADERGGVPGGRG